MKNLGLMRRVDDLGRIVIPSELRERFNIQEKDLIEIFVSGSAIVLRKVVLGCCFCDSAEDVVTFKDKLICQKCKQEIFETEESNTPQKLEKDIKETQTTK